MENDNDFEKDFQKKAKLELLQELDVQKRQQKLAWSIVVALVAVIVIETVIFSVILVNSLNEDESYDSEEMEDVVTPEDYDIDVGEEYDEEGNIVGLEQNCINNSGEKLEFTYDKAYKRYDSGGSLIETGSYDLVNGSLVALKDEAGVKLVLYYDGNSVAEGLSLYYCDGESRALDDSVE